jgi:hypothetical protein
MFIKYLATVLIALTGCSNELEKCIDAGKASIFEKQKSQLETLAKWELHNKEWERQKIQNEVAWENFISKKPKECASISTFENFQRNKLRQQPNSINSNSSGLIALPELSMIGYNNYCGVKEFTAPHPYQTIDAPPILDKRTPKQVEFEVRVFCMQSSTK